MKKYFLIASLFFVALFSVSCKSPTSRVNVDENDIAMKGFDPVAYFTVGKPVKGNEKISYNWQGAKWLFSNDDHKSLFIQNPEGYAPQYGGYWAYAVSRGSTADIDPSNWSIEDGKLYLNLNDKVQTMWMEDIPGNIKMADENWPGVIER